MRTFLGQNEEQRDSGVNSIAKASLQVPATNEEPTIGLTERNVSPERPNPRHPWTMIHSHYALMGGFAFDSSTSPRTFLPPGISHLKVNSDSIALLASVEPKLIPNISAEEITDKSKANSLAKAIVCVQASWFLVQCISRIGQGIGISLLELNTFAHAVSAVLVFLL